MPQIIHNERLCLFCRHFRFEPGEEAYSDVTPGYDACFECVVKSRTMPNRADKYEFVEWIRFARTCDRFEPDDEIKP